MKRNVLSVSTAVLVTVGGIMCLAASSASADNDKNANRSDLSGTGSITFEEFSNVDNGELPLTDDAAAEAMSTQNVGSGTVVVPGEGDPDQKDDEK